MRGEPECLARGNSGSGFEDAITGGAGVQSRPSGSLCAHRETRLLLGEAASASHSGNRELEGDWRAEVLLARTPS